MRILLRIPLLITKEDIGYRYVPLWLGFTLDRQSNVFIFDYYQCIPMKTVLLSTRKTLVGCQVSSRIDVLLDYKLLTVCWFLSVVRFVLYIIETGNMVFGHC